MFFFGNWNDSLEVSKIFFSIQSKNGSSEKKISCIFLRPELIIVTLHTYVRQFLSTLVQRIWLSVKNFYPHWSELSLFQQQSENNISMFTLSVKKEKSPNSNFLLVVVICEILLARFLLFKLFNILVAACSSF